MNVSGPLDMNEMHKTRQFNGSSIEKRMQNIFRKRSRVKNNVRQMETFDTIEGFNTQDEVEDEVETQKNEIIEKSLQEKEALQADIDNMQTSAENSFQETGEKWKKAFHNLTSLNKDDFKFRNWFPPRGLHKLLSSVFFLYPTVSDLIIDDFVEVIPDTMEPNMSDREFKRKKEDDKDTLKHSAYELGYVLVAIIFANMMYCRIYGDRQLKEAEKVIRTGFYPVDSIFQQIFALQYYPCFFFFTIFEAFKSVLSFVSAYPTIRFICIFILCYFLVYFFLERLTTMFLDALLFKANGSMYTFLIVGWVIMFITNLSSFIAILSTLFYIIGMILYLVFSLYCAPMAQMFFVFYVLYAFLGTPVDWLKMALDGLFGSKTGAMAEVSLSLQQSTQSDQKDFFFGFDYLLHKYCYKYLFLFLMILFFLFKTIQSAIELKLVAVRSSVSMSHAYITIALLVIYFAKMLNEKPEVEQKYEIRPLIPIDKIKEKIQKPIDKIKQNVRNTTMNAATSIDNAVENFQNKVKTFVGKKPVSDSSNIATDNSSLNTETDNSSFNDYGNLSQLYARETGNY